MSMDQLMALVPIEAATSLSTTTPKGRRSRWERSTVSCRSSTRFGPKEEKSYNPPPFVDLPPGLTPLQMDQFLREQRLEELSLKLEKGELEYGDPDIRPPSPPPAYDRNGTRMNMRETRVRNAMLLEHQRLIEFMAKNVPGFIPPTDFKPLKKIRRIIIPQEKYPEYNFMGLIIGPRGCNHKRLESESGAQISIRGRGTQKEGKKTDHQTEEEAAMPQHIHIAADTEESLDKAVALIEPLLNPFHPAHEEFKKKGLEQLALVNGVALTKIDSRCTVCGALGHLNWECPDADFQSFQKANVKCSLCGDKGHVTMDCKLAKNLSSEDLAEVEKKAQGILQGGPQHFSGGGGIKSSSIPPPPPPPPPTSSASSSSSSAMGRTVDPLQLDIEFSQMMSELIKGKESNEDMVSDPLKTIPDSGMVANGNRPMNWFSGFPVAQTHLLNQFGSTAAHSATHGFNGQPFHLGYSGGQENIAAHSYDAASNVAGTTRENSGGVAGVMGPMNANGGGTSYNVPWPCGNGNFSAEMTGDGTQYTGDAQTTTPYYAPNGYTTPYTADAWTQHLSQMLNYCPNVFSYTMPQQGHGVVAPARSAVGLTDVSHGIRPLTSRPSMASSIFPMPQPPLCGTTPSEVPLPCPPAEEDSDGGEDMMADEPVEPPPPLTAPLS